MSQSLLRERRAGHHAEVTPIELFFDLVFVIAVTQLSHTLLGHLTLLGALETAILLIAVWSVWVYTAWITNWLNPGRMPVRLMLFALMVVGIVLSSSLPEAFGERGLAFAGAYVVFHVGRTLFMLWAVRDLPELRLNFLRVLIWLLVGGVLWITGALLSGEARIFIWIAALTVDSIGPAVAFWVPGLGRSDTHTWNIEGTHMAERIGLFVMIALGESVLVTGIGFTELPWTPEVIAAMAVSLLQSIAIWWIYFSQHASAASAAIAASDDPGRVARQAYTYVPILLIAGIVVSAVGDELVLEHPSGHIEAATAWVLVVGPALYLLGAVLFKVAVFNVWSGIRLGGLAAIVALLVFAGSLSPLQLSAATTAILLVVAIWEAIVMARHPERYPMVKADGVYED